MSEQNKSQLIPTFGLFTVFMISLSSMIGSGVFKKVAPMSADVQSSSLVMLAWVLGGLISLFGALSNAEVGSIIAEPGGQYAYFKHMYGRFTAYMYGWTMLSVVQTATAAAVAVVFASATNEVLKTAFLIDLGDYGVKFLAISAIALFTFVNYRGAKMGGMVNAILASAIVIALLLIMILNFTIGGGSMANMTHVADAASVKAAVEGLSPDKLEGLKYGYEEVTQTWSSTISSLFAAMLGVFWAYEGWNNLGYLGAEVKDAKRNIPLGLTMGILFVMFIYTTINFSYLYVLPVEKFINVKYADTTIAAVEVVKSYLGAGGVILIASLIAIANFSTTNNSILTAPRVSFAMAQDGLFFDKVAEVHPEYKTPATAVLIMGIASCLFVLSNTFDQLTEMLVFASFIFYFMAAVGVFVLRRKMPDAPRSFRVPSILPIIFALFSLVLVYNTIMERPILAAQGLGLMALGIPLYFYFEDKNKQK
jgi:APA family basic amino acid/polyamine antiporter